MLITAFTYKAGSRLDEGDVDDDEGGKTPFRA
jgi:hypothetical protein